MVDQMQKNDKWKGTRVSHINVVDLAGKISLSCSILFSWFQAPDTVSYGMQAARRWQSGKSLWWKELTNPSTSIAPSCNSTTSGSHSICVFTSTYRIKLDRIVMAV